jgi:hypothetical protein
MEVLKFAWNNIDNVVVILVALTSIVVIFLKSFMPLLKKLATLTDSPKDDNFLKFCESGLLSSVSFLSNATEIFKEMKGAINEVKDEAKKKQLWESYDKLKAGYKELTKK